MGSSMISVFENHLNSPEHQGPMPNEMMQKLLSPQLAHSVISASGAINSQNVMLKDFHII